MNSITKEGYIENIEPLIAKIEGLRSLSLSEEVLMSSLLEEIITQQIDLERLQQTLNGITKLQKEYAKSLGILEEIEKAKNYLNENSHY